VALGVDVVVANGKGEAEVKEARIGGLGSGG